MELSASVLNFVLDAHSIPQNEETLHLLAESKYFTKLDIRSGHWQVEMDEADKHQIAFHVEPLRF